MKKCLGFSLLCGVMLMGAAQADAGDTVAATSVDQAAHVYAGVSVGAAKSTYLSDDLRDFVESNGIVAASDEFDTSTKIYVGIAASTNLDFRISYADLGKYTVKGKLNDVSTSSSANISASIDVKGIYAEASLKAPFSDHQGALYAKLGLGVVLAKQDASASVISSGVTTYSDTLSQDDSGGSFSLGLGVSYLLNKHWGVRAEAERYFINIKEDDDDSGSAKMKVNMASAGVFYRF